MKIFLVLFLTFFTSYSQSKVQQYESKERLISKADNGDFDAILNLAKYYSFPETKEGLIYFNKWEPLVAKNIGQNDLYSEAKVLDLYSFYSDMFVNGQKNADALKQSSLKNINSLFSDKIGLITSYYKKGQYTQALYFLQQIENSISDKQVDRLYKTFSDDPEFHKGYLYNGKDIVSNKLILFNLLETMKNISPSSNHDDFKKLWARTPMNDDTFSFGLARVFSNSIRTTIESNVLKDILFIADKFEPDQFSLPYSSFSVSYPTVPLLQQTIELYEITLKIRPDKIKYYEKLAKLYVYAEEVEKWSQLELKNSKYYSMDVTPKTFISQLGLENNMIKLRNEVLKNSKYLISRYSRNTNQEYKVFIYKQLKRLAAMGDVASKFELIDFYLNSHFILYDEAEKLLIDLHNRGSIRASNELLTLYLDKNYINKSSRLKAIKILSSLPISNVTMKLQLVDLYLNSPDKQYKAAEKVLVSLARNGVKSARDRLKALYQNASYENESNSAESMNLYKKIEREK